MENLTVEEIELCLEAIVKWEHGFRVTGESWEDVEVLREKLERMQRLLMQRAPDVR